MNTTRAPLSNTSTNVAAVDHGYKLIWIYVTWIIYFFLVALPNLLVTLTVLRYKALRNRKEYVMMASLCFADFLDITSGYTAHGIRRLLLIYQGMWSMKQMLWSCIVMPHKLIYWCAMPGAAFMLVTLSIDRLICVSAPLKYFQLTSKHAYRMVGSVYVLCITFGMIVVGYGFQHRDKYTNNVAAACFNTIVVREATNGGYFSLYYLNVQAVGSLVSVVLYICVGVVYWKKKQQMISDERNIQGHVGERQMQLRATKSVAISCLCTAIFVIIPLTMDKIAYSFSKPLIHLSQTMWLLPPINPMCNIIIYLKRQKHVRKGIVGMFKNKEMPPVITLWQ